MLSRRPALAVLFLLLLAFVAAGCGEGPGNRPSATAPNEGPYVTTGGLRYQVQMSRVLNPFDAEDADYLDGIPHPNLQVANGTDVWFGVFLRVEHHFKNGPQLSAEHFALTDTEGHVLLPTTQSNQNPYAYHPRVLKTSTDVIPNPDSTAAQAPIGGELLLFKVNQTWLENRPVELKIYAPAGGPNGVASVTLDI
jgi:hypothetical protein